MSEQSLIIPVDFDGTIVKHRFPAIGPPVPHAIRVLKRLVAAGHRVVLWTCRSNWQLIKAAQYLDDRGVFLHGINSNELGDEFMGSPKVYGHITIDDTALGCPCIHDPVWEPVAGEPQPSEGVVDKYVDWITVERMLEAMDVLQRDRTIE